MVLDFHSEVRGDHKEVTELQPAVPVNVTSAGGITSHHFRFSDDRNFGFDGIRCAVDTRTIFARNWVSVPHSRCDSEVSGELKEVSKVNDAAAVHITFRVIVDFQTEVRRDDQEVGKLWSAIPIHVTTSSGIAGYWFGRWSYNRWVYNRRIYNRRIYRWLNRRVYDDRRIYRWLNWRIYYRRIHDRRIDRWFNWWVDNGWIRRRFAGFIFREWITVPCSRCDAKVRRKLKEVTEVDGATAVDVAFGVVGHSHTKVGGDYKKVTEFRLPVSVYVTSNRWVAGDWLWRHGRLNRRIYHGRIHNRWVNWRFDGWINWGLYRWINNRWINNGWINNRRINRWLHRRIDDGRIYWRFNNRWVNRLSNFE
jgi:hypothetical protein